MWRLRVQQWVKDCLWMLVHGQILPNEACCHRGMADSAQCQLCEGLVENIMHVVRDCPCAKEVWNVLHPQGRVSQFFELTCRDWLLQNLMCHEIEGESIGWAHKMAITC